MTGIFRRARNWLRGDILTELSVIRASLHYSQLEDRVLTIHYADDEVRFYLPDGLTDWNQRRLLVLQDFLDAAALSYSKAHFSLKGATVLDIGANQGNHTLYWAIVCKAGRCIAFEPSKRNRAILEQNIALNGLGDIVDVRAFGLADVDSGMEITRPRANHMGTTSFEVADGGSVPCRRLESLEIKVADFVKIDVEGMAHLVLSGARETLSQLRPPIYIEINRSEFSACHALLKSIGYRRTHKFDHENFIFEWGAAR